jgi:hypothetical protein
VTTSTAPDPPAPPETEEQPGRSRRGAPRALIIALVAAPTLLILAIMSGGFGDIFRDEGLFRFPELLAANTPTGGDMGAHVLLPQILKDSLLPGGNLIGWSNDWYAGFPALYFYFPLPALTTVVLDLFLPGGVGFKLVTIAGLVALPVATYFFVRWLGFSRPVSAIAAVSGGLFVFMESYSIFGANIKSTLAGEFSFSWSFALSLVYLGLVTRDTRENRSWKPWAGIVLALTALTHIVTTVMVVLLSIPLLFRRNGPRTVVSSWALGLGLSAVWSVPFLVRVLQGMTTDMGWSPVENVIGDANPGSPVPGEFVPILALGLIGVVWTLLRRDDVVVLVSMAFVPLAGYFLIALFARHEVTLGPFDPTILYNARLLPYWYFALFVFAGLALGLAVVEFARSLPQRRQNLILGLVLVALVLLNASALAIHDVPGWVRWNYEGYEGKAVYGEYASLMETVDELPPGRIMWEANSEMNQYGTPMALMLLPYWSEGHPSMEGLFFESSLTTPFHFLNASEVSERPSNPVRGLDYRGLDFARAERHLAVYDVAYYLSFTERATEAAREHGLREIAASPPWTVFALPDSSLVDVATVEPAVWDGGGKFLDPALAWYDDVEHLDHWLVEDGPGGWDRVSGVDDRLVAPAAYDTAGATVTNVELEDDRISFRTTAVGVPHLVKVSYFPNWQAVGAEGPYRAAPSLMVVVPTEEEVTLEFRNTSAENIGMALTVLSIGGLVAYAVVRRRSRRDTDLAEEPAV